MKLVWIGLIMFMAFASAAGDAFFKKAGEKNMIDPVALAIGTSIYLGTIVAWFFIFRHVKLSTVGVYYSIATVLFLTFLGVFSFKETLNVFEVGGLYWPSFPSSYSDVSLDLL
jgi:hypothetical protein